MLATRTTIRIMAMYSTEAPPRPSSEIPSVWPVAGSMRHHATEGPPSRWIGSRGTISV
jgi:hypothetical protein